MSEISERPEIERAALAICRSLGIEPDQLGADGQPAWRAYLAPAEAAWNSFLTNGSGEPLLRLERGDAQRICARLEFDASWDKVGSGYYVLKRQLQTTADRPDQCKETP